MHTYEASIILVHLFDQFGRLPSRRHGIGSNSVIPEPRKPLTLFSDGEKIAVYVDRVNII
jgi:hypothetical protein